MDKDRLVSKLKHLQVRKISRDTGLDYFNIRNIIVGRKQFPEPEILNQLNDYAIKVGDFLKKKNDGDPVQLRIKLNHLSIQKVADDTGLSYATVRNFMIGQTFQPLDPTFKRLEEYVKEVGTELKRRCN